MAKRNPISHIEWRTRDPERLKTFYGAVFNWKFSEDMPGYTFVDMGGKDIGGGIMPIKPEDQMPTGYGGYINVDDLAEVEEKLIAAGGKVMMSKNEVPGQGYFSVCLDPDGSMIGLWQSLPKKERKAAKKAQKAAKKEAKAAKKAAKKAEKKAKKKDKKDKKQVAA